MRGSAEEAVLASGKLIFHRRLVQEAGGQLKRGTPSLPIVEFDYESSEPHTRQDAAMHQRT